MKTASPPVTSNGKLHELESHLRQRIRGQDHVLPRIVSILRRGELGLTKPGRPRGSFLFLGPTGVGKTEVTLAFTGFLMSKEHLFRFDMSEYQTQESLGLLLGGKLGERGTLGMVYDKSRVGTLLFDEIEKAHPRVLDVFLQILDAARVTMASGETLELSGFYVVFTSNIGSADLMNLQYSTPATMERHVLTRAQQVHASRIVCPHHGKAGVQPFELRPPIGDRPTLTDTGIGVPESQGTRTHTGCHGSPVSGASRFPSETRRPPHARCCGKTHG